MRGGRETAAFGRSTGMPSGGKFAGESEGAGRDLTGPINDNVRILRQNPDVVVDG